MKKKTRLPSMFAGLIIALLFFCTVPLLCFGAGSSATLSCTSLKNYTAGQEATDTGARLCTISYVGDDSTGAVPNTTIVSSTYGLLGLYLYSVETNPGTTAPTDDWDAFVYDTDSVDLCAGNANNRDTSNSELAVCATSTQPYGVISGNLTVTISGNSNASATGTVKLYFVK